MHIRGSTQIRSEEILAIAMSLASSLVKSCPLRSNMFPAPVKWCSGFIPTSQLSWSWDVGHHPFLADSWQEFQPPGPWPQAALNAAQRASTFADDPKIPNSFWWIHWNLWRCSLLHCFRWVSVYAICVCKYVSIYICILLSGLLKNVEKP